MTTIATIPDHLELREGEEFDLRAVARNGVLVITRVLRTHGQKMQPVPDSAAAARPLFSEKHGGSVKPVIDPEDARLLHIHAKHVK